MSYRILLTMCCAILLSAVGCEKKAAPVAVGPFEVNSDTGVATGQAFGISFRVAGATGVESGWELSGNPQYSSPAEITLADDLTIGLETMDEGNSIALQVNDTKFGMLAVGDEVVIDDGRNVTVNGEQRSPQAGAPE